MECQYFYDMQFCTIFSIYNDGVMKLSSNLVICFIEERDQCQ